MNNIFKNRKGITLVALVITIIILLILAGISISTLTNNGLFERAREVEETSKNAQERENYILSQYENIMNEYLSENVANTKPQGPTLNNTADTKPASAQPAESTVIEADPSKGIVIKDKNENEWVWVEIPKSIFTNPIYTSANNENNVTESTDYEGIYQILNKYAGKYREGKTGQGLKWIDEWYALNGSSIITEKTSGLTDEQKQLNNGCGLTYYEYKENYEKMLSSIFENGGFWISRYEIGDGTATENNETRYYSETQVKNNENIKGIPVSKAEQIPYNYTNCSQSQLLASRMSTDNKTCSLLFGIQWDLTCKFLEENANWGTTIQEEKIALINNNSTQWGNYNNQVLTLNRGKYNISPSTSGSEWKVYSISTQDYVTNNQKLINKSVLLTTGSSDSAEKMNIYDFAGNQWEWTLEHVTPSNINPCAIRGGRYGISGSSYPAAYRNYLTASEAYYYNGFRATLY